MKEIEKLARELCKIRWGDGYCDTDFANWKNDWMELADHVIKREIEALKSIPSGLFDSTPYINDRIAELERQLKENK